MLRAQAEPQQAAEGPDGMEASIIAVGVVDVARGSCQPGTMQGRILEGTKLEKTKGSVWVLVAVVGRLGDGELDVEDES